jgi:hypothetical protein
MAMARAEAKLEREGRGYRLRTSESLSNPLPLAVAMEQQCAWLARRCLAWMGYSTTTQDLTMGMTGPAHMRVRKALAELRRGAGLEGGRDA